MDRCVALMKENTETFENKSRNYGVKLMTGKKNDSIERLQRCGILLRFSCGPVEAASML